MHLYCAALYCCWTGPGKLKLELSVVLFTIMLKVLLWADLKEEGLLKTKEVLLYSW